MKFFIDTTNNYLILYLDNGVNTFFLKEKTNNNVVSIANKKINDFFVKNNINWKEIDQVYLTVGPGTFTGIKVGFNILQTFNLVNKFKEIYCIDSFNLLKLDNKKPLLFISKTKVLYKEKKLFITKKVKKDINELKNLDNFITYELLTEEMIVNKINSKSFKKIKNMESIVLKY